MSDNERTQSNVPEFSVGDLAFSLKKTLEDQYGHVRVRGELGRVTVPRSGHMYANLKDDKASIDAVCWKGVLSKLSVKPEEGLEVIVTGRISTYPQRSNYQLIIESMELAGEGALLKMLEERKKRLAAEGLFAPERKRALPFLPKTIGVVTSSTGAVIRDILHRLEDRFPRDVLLWPVLVQGQGAAEQVAAAIEGFQSIEEHGIPRPDVLIVARGGGSLEDLMPFNEEIVVRAVANSAIPVISAVGHETDTTLCDFAADRRAPTPTGAAEIAVPVRAQLQAQVMDGAQRLFSAGNRVLEQRRERLEALSARMGQPQRLLEGYMQRADHAGERLSPAFSHYLSNKRERLSGSAASLRSPQERLSGAADKLSMLGERLSGGFAQYVSVKHDRLGNMVDRLRFPESSLNRARSDLERWSEQLHVKGRILCQDHQRKLDHAGKMLEAYSFEKVLERGFCVVRDENGQLVKTAASLEGGDDISLQFAADARVEAVVKGQSTGGKPKPKKKSPKPKPLDNAEQSSLF